MLFRERARVYADNYMKGKAEQLVVRAGSTYNYYWGVMLTTNHHLVPRS